LGPELLSGTRLILGELDILDIPLEQIPNYREYVREIVEELSDYARSRDPNFLVITRPGFDLLTWSQREFDLAEVKRYPDVYVSPAAIIPVGMPMRRYIQAIDGLVLDGQFCEPLRVPQAELRRMMTTGLRFLSVEHCRDAATASAGLRAAINTGVVAHIDLARADDFDAIPTVRPVPENAGNVEALSAARNTLFSTGSRTFGSKREWLGALQSTNYDVLVVDAFYNGNEALTRDQVHQLKFKQMGARRLVLARMNIGYADDRRYYWQREWQIGAPTWIHAFSVEQPGTYVVE
ncbi:MAG: alpha-1,4-polygalactosaminidase, partial [Rhodospirillaceae bacterium]